MLARTARVPLLDRECRAVAGASNGFGLSLTEAAVGIGERRDLPSDPFLNVALDSVTSLTTSSSEQWVRMGCDTVWLPMVTFSSFATALSSSIVIDLRGPVPPASALSTNARRSRSGIVFSRATVLPLSRAVLSMGVHQ